MRLGVPGTQDIINALERGTDSVEQLLGAVPRLLALLTDAERLVRRIDSVIDTVESTATAADGLVQRTDATLGDAHALLGRVTPLVDRVGALLEGTEPALVRLQPTLERLADTTDPREVDALVQVVDLLPRLAEKMETDIVPVLDSLSTVSPDLRELLAVVGELNEMLTGIPGMGWARKRSEDD